MKILHTVESYYPSVSGAPEVVRHLSERMVKHGHDVTVATRKLPGRKNLRHNGVKIIEFDIRPTSDSGMSIVTGLAGETKKYQDYLRHNEFDVVMTYAAQQWTTDLMFEVIDEINAKKVLVPCGYSALYDPAYKKYFEKLPNYLRKFDATIYLAEDYRDINFARQHKIRNTYIIPNGADENEFSKPISRERRAELRKKYGIDGLVIMTLANYTGEKGHTELLYLFKRLPVTKATLISAGGITPHVGCFDMFKEQSERVNNSRKFPGKKIAMVDGANRRDIVDLLKMADLFVFLSNIEASPLVLFEAAAAGLPFIATNAGNSAEIAKWTGGGIIIKTIKRPNGRVTADLKSALWEITRLAYQPKKREKLGQRAHNNWKKRFTWEILTKEYLDLYQNLLKAKDSK